MSVVKNLLIRGGADFSNIYKQTGKLQQTMTGFAKGLKVAGIATTLALVAKAAAKAVAACTQSAMTVESAMYQISRMMGNNTESFNKWANNQASAFGMSEEEAYKYGSTFGNLVSNFSKDTATLEGNTESLLKAAAVVASSTGRTFEDVSERIRSGLLGSTEAIEDLGIYTQISFLQSTEAFKKYAGSKSWAQLDYNTQQQIRLTAILEQAQKKYGDTLANTTASSQQRFVAELKNIKTNLGQAFLPIYQSVLPALTTMTSWLARAADTVAQFSQALFGKKAAKQSDKTTQSVKKQASAVTGLGNAVAGAAKKAKSLAVIDEINKLGSTDTGSGIAGGDTDSTASAAATLAGTANTSNAISETVRAAAEKVKAYFAGVWQYAVEKFLPLFERLKKAWNDNFGGVGKALGDMWAEMQPVLQTLLDYLGKYFIDTVATVFEAFVRIFERLAPIIGPAVTGLIQIIGGICTFLNGVFSGDWKKAWDGIVQILNGAMNMFDGIFRGRWATMWEGVKRTVNGLLTFLEGVFTGNWSKVWQGLVDIVAGIFETLWGVIKVPINGIISGINLLIRGLNKIHFDLPDWVPGIGGRSFGISIPTIPKLANGGYVGANNPMLALIGDNRQEGEIVAPESKIYEQVVRALKDSNGKQPIALTINFGGSTIYRRIIDGINEVQADAGMTLLNV